jgi:hypothetical protein
LFSGFEVGEGFFDLVYTNNGIFPVRTVYNGTTQNIGVNYFTSKEPFWFAGPDIVASILLTGKVPRIRKAIAVSPHGKQEGLRSVSLRGMVEIDANKHTSLNTSSNSELPTNPIQHFTIG